MKINLYEINYYFLTYNNKIRRDHMIKQFQNYKIYEVNPAIKGATSYKNLDRYKSGGSGFIKILDLACINQDKNKPFQPFVIFEDDIKKKEFPSEIEIPDDADILYIGLSTWGMTNKKTGVNNSVCFKNIDENIIKVYNMLSLHGIIICSMRGLLLFQKTLLEDFFTSNPWDISICQIQPYINAYALKNPLVYQFKEVGGQEIFTNINYENKCDKIIAKEWINNTNISIITNFDKNIKL